MVENTVHPTPRTIAACTGHAAFRLVAEADGNRTRLSRVAAHTGFEDRGAHQDPDASKQAF